MSVGPFWRYYGGKWRTTSRYPAPEYTIIVEPFAGAAGYSCRYNARNVRLFDVDDYVVGTWRYLLRASAAEIRAIPDLPEGANVDDLLICQEARWLVGWWCNEATMMPCKTASVWAQQGGSKGWGPRPRERIARDVDRIRHWTIEQRPWWDVPQVEATWFVDPPYSTRAGRKYRHSVIDFVALGTWCRTLPGQVIVCEQEGADWLPFAPLGVHKSTRGTSHEVMWCSGRGSQLSLHDAELGPGTVPPPSESGGRVR